MIDNWKVEYLNKLYQDFPNTDTNWISNIFDNVVDSTKYEYYDKNLDLELEIYKMAKTVITLIQIAEI